MRGSGRHSGIGWWTCLGSGKLGHSREVVSRGWPCIDGVRVLILIGWLWGTISSIPKFTNGDFPKPGVLYCLV